MSWLQLHLQTNRDQTELLEDVLLACGAVSVTLADNADQPILEPGVGETPLWSAVKLSALFEADTDTDMVLVHLSANVDRLPLWRWEILEDQPWERAWMENFHPVRCGERLWICPSWCEPPRPEAINLLLDPGLAFGSGSHATTFMCLQWLDGLSLEGKTVIDYGCGSGILGIAAALLGARHVIAVDNDPQALLATRENASRNGIGHDRLMVYPPDQQPAEPADYLVANILAAPLIDLAEHITESTRAGGQLCLSGIVKSQIDAVCQAYDKNFHFQILPGQDDWIRLSAAKIGLDG